MPISAFTAALEERKAFFTHVMRYVAKSIQSLMQSVTCNALHSADARCCRWLLSMRDRANSDEFPCTQEYVAAMLGVRRPTVTLICALLQREGLIAYGRGRVAIVNRAQLEARACECYHAADELMSDAARAHVHQLGIRIGAVSSNGAGNVA
jgi:CRP-like cAMP-binding protein